MPSVHLLIKGKVQGVFYRARTKETAERFAISGWVKNTSEGHVEVVASGEESKLQQFIEWCGKGPERAVVTDVIVTESSQTDLKDFNIIR